jgi:hypothetical protein
VRTIARCGPVSRGFAFVWEGVCCGVMPLAGGLKFAAAVMSCALVVACLLCVVRLGVKCWLFRTSNTILSVPALLLSFAVVVVGVLRQLVCVATRIGLCVLQPGSVQMFTLFSSRRALCHSACGASLQALAFVHIEWLPSVLPCCVLACAACASQALPSHVPPPPPLCTRLCESRSRDHTRRVLRARCCTVLLSGPTLLPTSELGARMVGKPYGSACGWCVLASCVACCLVWQGRHTGGAQDGARTG